MAVHTERNRITSCTLSDVDECALAPAVPPIICICAPPAPCEALCVNTVGSYTCGCTDGYVLNSDDFTCDGKYIGTTRDKFGQCPPPMANSILTVHDSYTSGHSSNSNDFIVNWTVLLLYKYTPFSQLECILAVTMKEWETNQS